MKKYKIPVGWMVYDSIDVVAESLEEAIKIAKVNQAKIPLGLNPEYEDGSYYIDDGNLGCSNIKDTADFIRDCYDEYESDLDEYDVIYGKGIHVNNCFIDVKEDK